MAESKIIKDVLLNDTDEEEIIVSLNHDFADFKDLEKEFDTRKTELLGSEEFVWAGAKLIKGEKNKVIIFYATLEESRELKVLRERERLKKQMLSEDVDGLDF